MATHSFEFEPGRIPLIQQTRQTKPQLRRLRKWLESRHLDSPANLTLENRAFRNKKSWFKLQFTSEFSFQVQSQSFRVSYVRSPEDPEGRSGAASHADTAPFDLPNDRVKPDRLQLCQVWTGAQERQPGLLRETPLPEHRCDTHRVRGRKGPKNLGQASTQSRNGCCNCRN